MIEDQRGFQQSYYDRHYPKRAGIIAEQLDHPMFRSFYDRLATRLLDGGLPAGAGHERPARIYETGCGEGFLASALHRKAGERNLKLFYTAADLSGAALDLARPNLGDVELLVGDATEVTAGLPSDSQDLVIVKNLLHHLEDPAGLLREAARVAGPEGKVAVIEARLGCPQFWVFGTLAPRRERYFFYGAQRNRKAVADAGLMIVSEGKFSWLPFELAFHIRFSVFRRLLSTDDPRAISRVSRLDEKLTETLPWFSSYALWITAPVPAEASSEGSTNST